DKVEQRADQGIPVAEQLCSARIALPAHLDALQTGLGSGTQSREQLRWRQSILQRKIAPSEHQHVANLMLQLVQAIFQTSGKALLLFGRQATLLEVAGVEQGA